MYGNESIIKHLQGTMKGKQWLYTYTWIEETISTYIHNIRLYTYCIYHNKSLYAHNHTYTYTQIYTLMDIYIHHAYNMHELPQICTDMETCAIMRNKFFIMNWEKNDLNLFT